MDTVFTDTDIIVVTPRQPALAPRIPIDEKAIMAGELILRQANRFGVVDLWNIHRRKRYANVYPRRID